MPPARGTDSQGELTLEWHASPSAFRWCPRRILFLDRRCQSGACLQFPITKRRSHGLAPAPRAHHRRLPRNHLDGGIEHDPEQRALAIVDDETGEEEVLSFSLAAGGVVLEADQVLVKDWSEHSGLARAFQEAGVVRIVGWVRLPPFVPIAYRVVVL